MKGYGEFCPMALAAEIVAERWTLLILREMAFGASRFNDIHRGIRRISPALLTQRLRRLEQAGIVKRTDGGGYRLSNAGEALVPAIDALAAWSKSWLPATLSQARSDPDVIMWDMHRRMNFDLLPEDRITLLFTFVDQPQAKRDRWILFDRAGAQFCTVDPGFETDLYVTTDAVTMTLIWYGDLPLKTALKKGALTLDGPPSLCAAFPSWIKLSRIADIPRRHPIMKS